MKNFVIFILSVLVFLNTGLSSSAQELKDIKLKDGTVLKGHVVALKDGIYTFDALHLGNVEIPEADILSIGIPQVSSAADNTNTTQKTQIEKQVQEVQGSILADEGIMKEVENLSSDKEIQALLSDPKLIEDIMSFDPNKIEQNGKIQDLMSNPKMQELMKMIEQKMPADQQ